MALNVCDEGDWGKAYDDEGLEVVGGSRILVTIISKPPLGSLSEKKTGLCGKNSKTADPPHPPSLGNPCYQKKSWVYFSF